MDTDQSLLSQYHRGDAMAFERLVEAHAGMVHAVASRVTGNAALASDVAQETFLALARSGGTKIECVSAWLHAIACRRARDIVRGESRRRAREACAAEHLYPDQPEASWQQIEPWVDEAIARLPVRTRGLLIERYMEGRTQQDLAKRHGLSQSTVSRILESGLDELRTVLRSHDVLCGSSLALLISANSSQAAPGTLAAALGKIALSGADAANPTALSLSPLLAMTTTKVLLVAVCAAAVAVLMLKNSRKGGKEAPQPSQLAQAPVSKAPAPSDDQPVVPALPAQATAARQMSPPPSLDDLWAEAEGLPDDRALVVEAFKNLGGSLKEEFVERDIESIIQSESGFKSDRDAFEAGLRRRGTSLEQFKEQRREAMIIAIMRSRITRGITDPAAKEKAIDDWLSGLRKASDASKAKLPGAAEREE